MTSMTGMRPTMLATLPNRHPACKRASGARTWPPRRVTFCPGCGKLERSSQSRLPSLCACYPTIHGPSGPAPGPLRPRRSRRQPEVVLAPRRRRTSSPRWTPRLWEATKHDPVRLLGSVDPVPARGAGPRPGLPRPARRGEGRSRRLPRRRALVLPQGRRRRTDPDRLLLAGVRHHRGAAAVLRRPRHPRRRPPQGRQRPRRAAHRRRPALPRRLLQAVALPGGLAAGAVPRPRPRRAADLAAPRGERRPRR